MIEVCDMVLELAILGDLPPATKIQHMAIGFRTAQAEVARTLEELMLQVLELYLKARPTTPPTERECCHNKVVARQETMNSVVCECLGLLSQSLRILISLQEDPSIQ